MNNILTRIGLFAVAIFISATMQAQLPFENLLKSGERAEKVEKLRGKYKVDANKNITITRTIEGLNMDAQTAITTAYDYLEGAYQICKFKIDVVNETDHYVIAKSSLDNFESYALFPNNYTFNAPITLRFDAKEGRLRIMAVLRNYEGTRINGNVNEQFSTTIADVPPVNENSTEKKKMHIKAFLSLYNKIQDLFDEAEGYIQSHNGVQVEEDW